MADSKRTATGEGRRQRKRRQTRERIEQAAVSLFLQRGFETTTVEDITEAADVSKRSFFDYFPSKEEVVFAWQDGFADRLMAAIAARPAEEPLVAAVEAAITATVIAAVDERSLALGELIHRTPALKARDQLKYARLEQKLAEALLLRKGNDPQERSRMHILAAVVIGALRVGAELWRQRPPDAAPQDIAHEIFAELWTILAEFGDEAKAGR
ncbi:MULTISPECIES: TetR family transcriptional regulator [unclassified Rhizobium]|uniref:TetR family transcriptional regulator n=1 Tax=unclassified Rhizobium TaxID=2613769 RepID=UPI0007EABB13|nr:MULTISPECIES: TetR family transcriptional regulator [unclassified Rhizobium]ANM08931.1 TetR family transcriptional regulator protein [Rhizobium sp. N324]ANM15445.1 TetR family transcriptional regulator protein [Rhizobium sp. N541]ANM21833.1 TetR family transcriptional regulator protein [Rhizobium sp. N941]OYD02499.1 TetR family transcriptional regulator protein [Rhizobium sp. N4311]